MHKLIFQREKEKKGKGYILYNRRSRKWTIILILKIYLSLRLAFHDCVGGCDGCINVNNHDNAGLVGYGKIHLQIKIEPFIKVNIPDNFEAFSLAFPLHDSKSYCNVA